MLAGGLDGLYRSILASGHKLSTRVEVWAGSARIDTYGDAGVPYNSGSVSATLQSRVVRTLALSVDRSLFPANPAGLLAPFGNYLKVYSGVQNYGGTSYMWPVFVGRINDITLDDNGTVSLSAFDRAADIQDSYFLTPQQSMAQSLIQTQFRVLVRNALPAATFGTFDALYYTTPNLIWNADRASACDDLANASNQFWYPLANGDFVMRQIAWTNNTPSLLTLTDGNNGILLGYSASYSRTNVWNQITVAAELADGTTPVYATAQDMNPGSPTYVNGKFGAKGQFYSMQAASSQGQALSLARQILQRNRALTEQWTAQIPPDASMELGDPFVLQTAQRTSTIQVVSAFTLSLDAHDTMYVAFQAQTPSTLTIPIGV